MVLGFNSVVDLNSPVLKADFVPTFFIYQMHELGIYSRLDQIFDAPTVVKEVLTSQFGLDSSVCFLTFMSSSY